MTIFGKGQFFGPFLGFFPKKWAKMFHQVETRPGVQYQENQIKTFWYLRLRTYVWTPF